MNTFRVLSALVFFLLLSAGLAASEMPVLRVAPVPTPANPLPLAVQNALLAATKGTLYSLNPGSGSGTAAGFHGYITLGQVELDPKALAAAITAFQDAAIEGAKMNGLTLCFNPRHGLRVTANGHTYDFVLCYECSQLYIYEDDKKIAAMNAVGSPKVLNDLLDSAKVPVSGPSQAQLDAEAKKGADTKARFLAEAPQSLKALWDTADKYGPGPDTGTARAALKKEIPDTSTRVRALLGYYGAGGDAWNRFGAYEVQAVNLLMDYSDTELAAALQAGPLSDVQMEGAARWLTGYRYSALPSIPAEIQAKLLAYVLKGNDDKKVALAKRFFSPPLASPPTATAK